jgi:hypothetical protein
MQQKRTSRKPIKSGQGQGLEADQEILVYKIDVEFRSIASKFIEAAAIPAVLFP